MPDDKLLQRQIAAEKIASLAFPNAKITNDIGVQVNFNETDPEPANVRVMQSNLKDYNSLSDDMQMLINGIKNINAHLLIFKKLLNLKDKSQEPENFCVFRNPFTVLANIERAEVNEAESNLLHSNDNLGKLFEKCDELKNELQSSHLLTSCLVYNLQRLHRELTGIPVDLESAEDLLGQLQKDHGKLKTNEAILKYELQEKRKLLSRFRFQLDAIQEEWRNLRVRNSESETEWQGLREEFANRQASEESAFGEIEGGVKTDTPPDIDSAFQSECDLPIATASVDNAPQSPTMQRRRIDVLEEQCNMLFNNLVQNSQRNELLGDRMHILVEADPDETDDEFSIDEFGELLEEMAELDETGLADAVAFDITDLTEEVTDNATSDLPWDSGADNANTLHPNNDISVATSEDLTSSLQNPTPNLLVERRVSANSSIHEGFDDAEESVPLVLANLRRKALETIVNRLKDERMLHEDKEQSLKDQIEKIKSENEELQQQLASLKLQPCEERTVQSQVQTLQKTPGTLKESCTKLCLKQDQLNEIEDKLNKVAEIDEQDSRFLKDVSDPLKSIIDELRISLIHQIADLNLTMQNLSITDLN